jgi:hypothetical protein
MGQVHCVFIIGPSFHQDDHEGGHDCLDEALASSEDANQHKAMETTAKTP